MKYSKYWLVIFFVNFCISIFSNELEENLLDIESDSIFVSLGSHCEVAVFLNEHQLRTRAFPFDWLLSSSHDQFISLLDDDFQHLLDERYFFQNPDHHHVIENYYYEIEFRHDWPFSDLITNSARYSDQVEQMQAKYQRRIERFRQLRYFTNKVFFIRVAFEYLNEPNPFWKQEGIERITIDQAKEIKEALDRYFPNLNFILVIINYQEEYTPVISGIEKVIEYKIRKTKKHADYAKLFKMLDFR